MTIIPFASWEPDKPALGNTATEAKNVIPRSRSYGPLGSLSVVVDSALDGACRGAASFKGSTGDVYTYAGTDATLYSILGGSAADAGRTDDYSGTEYNSWRFIQFGNYAIATNGADVMQSATIGGQLDDLDNAPVAKYVCVIRDFLFTGYTNGDSTLTKWSGNNNITQWTAALNSSGEQRVYEGGIITGLVGGEFGLVFLERAIVRVMFVGGDIVFQFDQIENQHGCDIPGSLITYGKQTFYHAADGFYTTDGVSVVPIGDENVDNYFASDFASGYPHRVSAAIDPVNNLVIWAYPGSGHSSGAPNKALLFNFKTGGWSRGVFDSQIVFPAYTLDTSLEEISTMFADLEAVTPSLDSPTWRGGELYLGSFNSSNKLCDFSGSALEAIISTGEMQLAPNRTAFVSSVRPLVDVSSATMRVGRRNRLADSISYTSAISMQTSGRCPTRARGRYHRFEVTIPAAASWTHAQGVDVDEFTVAGKR